MGGDDHRCAWRERAEGLQVQLDQANATVTKLTEKLTAIEGTLEKLQRHVFGQRSEKMPPVAEAIRDPAKVEAARIAALRTRREHIEKRRQLVTRRIEHTVREDQKTCPKCGGHDFSRLGGGDVTELYDLVPAKVERQLLSARIASVAAQSDLAEARILTVPKQIVDGTGEALRQFGAEALEGLVLWAGELSSTVARVMSGLVPPQHPIRDERGVGYFVDGDALFELNLRLHRSGLVLLAQVHSHPNEAYHSAADDRYAIATAAGSYSLVAPNFGKAFAVSSCAVYRLESGGWTPVPDDDISRWIRVV